MAGPVALPLIASLTTKTAQLLVRRYGIQAAIAAFQLWGQWRDGRASKQKEQTFKSIEAAIPKVLESVESKEIRVIPGAFNSSAEFIAKFEAAALISISLALLNLSAAIKRVGSSLEAIQNELAIANVAKIQGWATDGFGAHVYRFVQCEMVQATNDQARENGDRGPQRGQRHYFYVWNPDTDWYPVFERMNAEHPLGSQFGGYHHDLAAICMRMRTDRETLVQRGPHGRTAKFHLLIPAHGPLVIDHPIVFHENLFPLVITGQRHRGVDFVWFNLVQWSQALDLRFVGNLALRENTIEKATRVGFMTGWTGSMACAIAAAVFPPCAPAVVPAALSCLTGAAASFGVGFGSLIYDDVTRKEICVLGNPIIFADEA